MCPAQSSTMLGCWQLLQFVAISPYAHLTGSPAGRIPGQTPGSKRYHLKLLLSQSLATNSRPSFSKVSEVRERLLTAKNEVKVVGARVTDSCRRQAFSTGDRLKKSYLLSRTALSLR